MYLLDYGRSIIMGTYISLPWWFFGVFKERQQAEQFAKEFDMVCTDLGVDMNDGKK